MPEVGSPWGNHKARLEGSAGSVCLSVFQSEEWTLPSYRDMQLRAHHSLSPPWPSSSSPAPQHLLDVVALSGAVCQVVAVLGFSPPTEEHSPWNLSFKEPSSLLPLWTERWPQKSGHPWVRLSQGSLLRCLWMLLCDACPLNESLNPTLLAPPAASQMSCFRHFRAPAHK